MSVKEHYDNHLSDFYAWMCGDRVIRQKEFAASLVEHKISPLSTTQAIDFGAGHGLQSIPLAQTGFQVLAVDFSQTLLNDLEKHITSSIKTSCSDMRQVQQHAHLNPELIICCGDTLLHLESKNEVRTFLKDCISILSNCGKIILSFRDYSHELLGDARLIPVKSDEKRILTCLLEYTSDSIQVTDILNEKENSGWKQKVNSYKKVRMLPREIASELENQGCKILLAEMEKGMFWIVGEK